MTSFWHSIRWRIFVYYTAIITLGVGILIGVFYNFERKFVIQVEELTLHKRTVFLLPILFGSNPRILEMEARGRPGRNSRAADHNMGDEEVERAYSPSLGSNGYNGDSRRRGPHSDRQYPEGRGLGDRADAESRIEQNRKLALERAEKDFSESGYYFFAQRRRDDPGIRSKEFPEELIELASNERQFSVWRVHRTSEHIYIRHRTPGNGIVMVGRPFALVNEDISAILKKTILAGVIVVVSLSIIGFGIISFSLRPIQRVSQSAERIANGDINERIDTENIRSELGQMANVLNKTFGRLGDALKRQIQFNSDASHELRTPVAAILADCQFSLKRERSLERYRETIEVCHESAQHMRSLIEDLRDLADFDEKNDALVCETVDMKTFLENVVSVMTPLAHEKGIEVKLEVENTTAQFDPMRMKQAILNLLSNAVRYTDETGQIFVRCYQQARSIVIEVKDTGIGIAPDKIKHIFDRFYRSDAARSKDTGGVGLGLSISKSIIEANGGEISVQSELSVGTCFRIRLGVE